MKLSDLNPMGNIPRLITIIVISIIWAIPVIWLIYRGDKIGPAMTYWRDGEFKTDTVYQPKYIPLPQTAKELMPAKEVVVYVDKPIPDYLLRANDSLVQVINDLKKDTVKINPTFLTLYPKAKKLISANLSKDTLSFDLLDITGSINREIYPIDASSFNYQYRNNSMFAEELKTRKDKNITQKKKIIRYDGIYLNLDRDFIERKDRVNGTIALDIWKIRVQGYAETGIKSPFKENRAGARIGYRLF